MLLLKQKTATRFILKESELQEMLSTESALEFDLKQHESIQQLLLFQSGKLGITEAGSIYLLVKAKGSEHYSSVPLKATGGIEMITAVTKQLLED